MKKRVIITAVSFIFGISLNVPVFAKTPKAIWGTDGAAVNKQAKDGQKVLKPTAKGATIKKSDTTPQLKTNIDSKKGDYTGSGQGWGTGQGD